jgi:uncharacterized membrane protein YsdA (DUF1294 family)
MTLVIGTILWVCVVTTLLGIVVYAVDRSTARQEHRK